MTRDPDVTRPPGPYGHLERVRCSSGGPARDHDTDGQWSCAPAAPNGDCDPRGRS